MAPRDVSQFVPWRVLWFCYQQLLTIQRANGYNCDAAVYMDVESYRNSQERYAVLIHSDGDNAEDHNVGGGGGGARVNNAVQITVMGSVMYGTDIPSEVLMALEQDVRTALQSNVDGMRPITGHAFSHRWNSCQRYIAALTAEKQAGFTLTCSYMYPQGSTW